MKDEKTTDNKKGENKVIKITLIVLILLMIAVGLIINFLIKTNEDIEAKIIGSMKGVDWSEEVEVSTESLDKFEKSMKDNREKYNKNIIIMHQYNGCGSCFEEILNGIKDKNYNKSELNITLVTTMHEDDMKAVYGDEIKDLNVFSDFDYQIGKKLKVFNEIDMRNEDVIIYIEGNDTEEYYFEESDEVFEYINSKIKK
ncbi:MAG: hypothetical protein IJH34_13860 [Romboutsia sp.]|nr:hypothetical protein [Romboutsia sp.]